MEPCLNETEVRVLGCLMEKELATPEYYPLTLNALPSGTVKIWQLRLIRNWERSDDHLTVPMAMGYQPPP